MFNNLFKKSATKENNASSHENVQDPKSEAMKRAIAAQRNVDPLIGAKIGAKQVTQNLINSFKTEKGTHIETVLTALGALAGYACQASVREEFVRSQGLTENQAFVLVHGADGKNYFFGDLLNKPLAETQYSVWSLAAGAAQQLGCKTLPDLADIFKHVSQTVGGADFGVPRVPDDHKAGDLPINFVKIIWPKMLPMVKQCCEKPSEWPILFGLAIQDVIIMGKEVIAPDLALTIVMESAIPMSKIELATT